MKERWGVKHRPKGKRGPKPKNNFVDNVNETKNEGRKTGNSRLYIEERLQRGSTNLTPLQQRTASHSTTNSSTIDEPKIYQLDRLETPTNLVGRKSNGDIATCNTQTGNGLST
jgi:hypothetical protein